MKKVASWIPSILIAAAFTPLVVVWLGPFPPIVGKMIFFRGAMSIVAILAAMYVLAITQRTPRVYPKQCRRALPNSPVLPSPGLRIPGSILRKVVAGRVLNPLFAAVGLFVLSAAISVALSQNVYRGFFGDGIRAGGLYTLLACFIFFVSAIFFFAQRDWARYVRVVLFVGAVSIAMFFLQYSEWGRSLVFQSGTVKQPGSFMGNPALFASFLILLEGYVVIGYRDLSRIWKYCALSVGVLALVALVMLEVRAALMGLAAGGLFVASAYGLRGVRSWRWGEQGARRVMMLALIVIVLCAALGAAIAGTRTHPLWQSVPVVRRVVGFSFESASVATRLLSWNTSVDAWKERPWFGWGLEQYRVAYNKHYDPAYAIYAEDWFDRAHNNILDILVMQGAVGVAAYLVIVAAVWRALKTMREYDALCLALGGVMVAYLVQGLFSVDHLDSYVLLFGLLAFLVSRSEQNSTYSFAEAPEQMHPKSTSEFYSPADGGTKNSGAHLGQNVVVSNYALGFARLLAIAVIIVSGYALYAWNGIPLLQAWRYKQALAGTLSPDELAAYAERFLSPYNFLQKELRERFLGATLGVRDGVRRDLVDALRTKAIESFEEMLVREPDDPRLFLRGAEVYRAMADQEHPEFFEKSMMYLEEAKKLSPHRQAILGLQAAMLGDRGKHQDAVLLARETLALEPQAAKSHYYLGMALAVSARDRRDITAEERKYLREEAIQELRTAQALGVKDNFALFGESDFRNMMILYEQVGDDDDFLTMYRIAQRLFPRNIDYYGIRLGAALGRKDAQEVIVIAERIKELDPRYTDDMDIIIDLAKKQKWNILDNL